jgi:ABC-type sugar transport system ATPase subunit
LQARHGDGPVIEATQAGAATVDAPVAGRPLLRLHALAKAFGPTQALHDGSLDLCTGEVHALVGENGSGKSTMVKIVSGVHVPDAGELELDGASAAFPATPAAAQRAGIVTVFQEVLVSEACSVLDNVWVGTDSPFRSSVPTSEKRRRAAEVLERLMDRRVDLDTPVEELSLSDRQACCIVRALMRNPRVLILDEATSALDVATRDRLFQMVGELRASGLGVVFITHRMDEISEVADRVTVLRSGATVGQLQRGEWTTQQLVQLMTGADRLTGGARDRVAGAEERVEAPVLTARGMQLKAGLRPFDVEIRAGELVGVAGLEGHGQTEFLDALRGTGAVAGEVVRIESGREVIVRSTKGAAKHGIAYVPRERGHALFRWMSIRENFGMPTLAQDRSRRIGLLNRRSTRHRLNGYIEDLGITLGDPEDAITTLSGGNQQKVVIARWLASNPRVLVLNDPTRGIDIGAKKDLYRLLVDLADRGLAVVMHSTEIDEHVELMDRVLVFREHELFCDLDRSALSRQTLVSAFFGDAPGGTDD